MVRPSAGSRWTLVAWGGSVLWGTLAVFLAAVTVSAFLVARNARRDQVLSTGLQTAIGLTRTLRTAGPPAGPERLRGIIERFEAPGVLYVQLVDGSGDVIAGSADAPASRASATAVRASIRLAEALVVDTLDAAGATVHDVYVPFRRPGPRRRPGMGGPPRMPDAEGEPAERAWGFRPGDAAVRVGVDAAPALWLTRWAWAQAAASALALLALGAVILRARRTARALALLEGQRRRREVLARLGEVSAVLAHEIRNPLAALKGHVQLAAEQARGGGDPAAIAERLDVAVDEAVRVEALVRGLLDYARDRTPIRAPVPVATILADGVASVDAALGPHPALSVACPPDLVADLDRDQAARAVANLVQNAREAAGPDGAIRVSANADGRDLIVAVEDSGPGVPEALNDRLFEPFVTGKVRGIGLGLAIVVQVVEAHGGVVAADRSPGLGGARFQFRIPMQAPG